jgi:ABC-type transporter Mla maintaining outer membrane lipid asymmetry permease subunit MlaE
VSPCVQVSEQVDSLRVLFTDPVDYLVTPRVLASMIAGPILNVLCFCMGEQHRGPDLWASRGAV